MHAVTIMRAIDTQNCAPSSTVRMRRPDTEPEKPPLAASEALNEVMYHAG